MSFFFGTPCTSIISPRALRYAIVGNLKYLSLSGCDNFFSRVRF